MSIAKFEPLKCNTTLTYVKEGNNIDILLDDSLIKIKYSNTQLTGKVLGVYKEENTDKMVYIQIAVSRGEIAVPINIPIQCIDDIQKI
jgi:hypothetical protein